MDIETYSGHTMRISYHSYLVYKMERHGREEEHTQRDLCLDF